MTENPSSIDSKAFEILVRQHHRRLLAYAISITGEESAAQDIVQEAFITAYKALDRFDTSRDFGSWMRGIVRNKYREWVRRQSVYTPLSDRVMESVDMEYARMDRATEQSTDLFGALKRCLGKLPDLMRRTVDLFYMKRLSGREVAEQLDLKEPVVRKRLQRAREQLAGCISSSLEVSHG